MVGWLVEIGREDLLGLGLNWFSIDSIAVSLFTNRETAMLPNPALLCVKTKANYENYKKLCPRKN